MKQQIKEPAACDCQVLSDVHRPIRRISSLISVHILFYGMVLVLVLGSSSCSKKLYAPDVHYVPEFTGGGQVEFQYSAHRYDIRNNPSLGSDLKLGYSPINKLGLIFTVNQIFDGSLGSNYNATFGAGYYDKIDSTSSFAVYLKTEKGEISYRNQNPEVFTNGFSLVPSYRKHFKDATLTFVAGLKYHRYKDIVFDPMRENNALLVEDLEYLTENDRLFQLEPSVNFNMGGKVCRFNMQLGRSFNLNGNEIDRRKTFVSLGLMLHFEGRKRS